LVLVEPLALQPQQELLGQTQFLVLLLPQAAVAVGVQLLPLA
jgi:hypothetical protein